MQTHGVSKSLTHSGGTAPSTVTVIATVAPLSPGSYQGTITFFGVGATNSGIAVTVNLTVLGPGSISIGAPSSGQVGVPVTITVTGVVNACANISLDFGDNSPQVLFSNTGGSVQHTYSTRGTYTIRAHPSNCTGTPPGIATFTIEILPTGQALSSIAAAPSPAQVGQQVTFTISGQGSCNSIQVNFGDGSSTFLGGTLPLQTTYAYAMSGSFTVTASGTGCTQQDNGVTTILTVNPVGTTGILNVTTTPVNGDIFVDGEWRGNKSISISLPAGSHTVSFGDVGGYTTPAQRSVTITANETMVIAVAYDMIVLEKVNLLSPSNDATGVSITPPFVWSGAEGANLYWLMVATSPSDFPTDMYATSCPNCVISGRTGLTNHTLPHTFPVVGRSTTLDVNTTYFWKVQAWNTNGARGDYSDAFSFATGAPESTPPQRPEIPPIPPTSASKAVLITHGWNAGAAGWVKEMAEDICWWKLGFRGSFPSTIQEGRLTQVCQMNDWDVLVYDWRYYADAAGWPLFTPPWTVYSDAISLGEALAAELTTKNYQYIHLIAHSAGSQLIDTATNWLKARKPSLTIHETFLDAYDPEKEGSRYGERADWADNYVDTRPVFPPFDATKNFLKHAFNVDVTPTLSVLCTPRFPYDEMICAHSRPYRFYGLSIVDFFIGDAYYSSSDPIGSTAGIGFPLSEEAGRSLENLSRVYQKGAGCKVNGTSCDPFVPSSGTLHYLPSAIAEVVVDTATATVEAVRGAGTTVYSYLKLLGKRITGLAPQQALAVRERAATGGMTEEPSYLAVNVTTASPVNTLRFNWSFAAAGEGLLRVFVGGNLVRQIDQRHVTPSSPKTEEIYIGGVGEPLPAGTHRITFRLDGFGANASGVELTDVELGLKAGPLAFPADTLPVGEQGVAYVYDLLAEGGMPPYTWSLLKGKLPGGLTLDTAGTITGTPTKAKTKTFTVQVADAAGGSATQDLTLQIVKSVKIKTKKLPKGMVGVPYSATLQATGGISPLTFGLVSGALPPGFAPLDPAMGQISGIPTTAGTFDFVAQVTSSGGSSHQKNIRIKIK